MFYVYALKSIKDGDLYIGSTNDLKKCFWKHNKGLVESTRPRRPFKLVYYEAYGSEKDARLREVQLKKDGRALTQLKKRIKNSLEI